MPSHHTWSQSPMLRRYSAGCTTRGAGRRTDCVAATEWTETSGSSVLSLCSGPKGMVGTSSACTDAAVTTCEEFAGVSLDVGEDFVGFPFVETIMVLSSFSEAESFLCINPSSYLFCS